MNSSQVLSLLVAALCIVAIGVSATTLESSVSTDPDEEIDTYEFLPIGQGDAIALQEQIEGDRDRRSSRTKPGDGDTSPSSQSSASDQDSSTGEGGSPRNFLEWLLDLLLFVLRVLVGMAVIVLLVGMGYRYRDRILEALRGLLGSDDETVVDDDAVAWPKGSPSNPVERAWLELVERVDPERPAVMTAAECAAAAKQTGLDSSAVEAITGAFDRVKYGGVPPDEERGRVEDALQRIDVGGDAGSGDYGSRVTDSRRAGGGDD